MAKMVKVVALDKGYYGHYREIGVEFEVPETDLTSDGWFQPVNKTNLAKAAETVKNNYDGSVKDEPIALSQIRTESLV